MDNCLACSYLNDNGFHTAQPWTQFLHIEKMPVEKQVARKGQRKWKRNAEKKTAVKNLVDCSENASTNVPEERQGPSKLGDSLPDDVNKSVEMQVSEMEDQEEPKRKAGAKMKIGKSLKNFYPKIKRYLKAKDPLDPSMRICNKNRMEMLEKYGEVLRPFLIELSEYVPSRTQAKKNKARNEEKQKKSEKKKAQQLLKEYDKICKKS